MSNVQEYKERMAFHPGYYVADVIEDMGISQNEFAARLGTTPKTVSTLVNGQIGLSKELAGKLSAMLGTSVDLWLNLQKEYDEKVLAFENEKELEAQEEVASMIDYTFFEKVAGLPHVKGLRERITNLCSYLSISDLRILMKQDFLVNYRRTGSSDIEMKNVVNSRAWVQTAVNQSKLIETMPFNADKLKESLPELRGMTVQMPEVFIPRMKEVFSQCGVAFVLLPHLRNSGVNGAVKWVSNGRVVLAMNNRGLAADRFWFSLFHEIKHVLQQKVKTTFVSYSFTEMMDEDAAFEREADTFAANYLIPVAAYKKFAPSCFTSDAEIVSFANSIGIHPGIVAGRLQHDGIIPQNRCAKLKEKYRIIYVEETNKKEAVQ